MMPKSTVNDPDSPDKKRLKEHQYELEIQYKSLLETVANDKAAEMAVRSLMFQAAKFESRYERILEEKKEVEKDKTTLEEENDQLWSVLIVRNQIEDLEESIDMVCSRPSKEEMVEFSKKSPECEYQGENISYHYVKFFYFVVISKSRLADDIKKILADEGVRLHDFCTMIAKIYKKTSLRIHNPKKKLTTEKIKRGLRMYGIDRTELLDCVDVLAAIDAKPLRRNCTDNQRSIRFESSSIDASSSLYSCSSSHVSQFRNEYQMSYDQPRMSYGQPRMSYGQPRMSYGQPRMSYGQPRMFYGQRRMSHGQSVRTFHNQSGMSRQKRNSEHLSYHGSSKYRKLN